MSWPLLLLLVALPFLANRFAPTTTAHFLVKLRRRMSGLRDHEVVLPGGVRIVYSEGGHGEPLILLHGLGAGRSSFEMVAGLLTKEHHLIIPDLPGFGDSGQAADGDYRIFAQVERFGQFVEALGLNSFHLGGNSMGGWIAAAYASKHPDKVKSLWLLAAAGTADLLDTEAVSARRDHGRYLLLAQNSEEFDAVLRRIFYRPPFIPYCVRSTAAREAAAYFPLHSKIFDQLLDHPYENQLEPHLPNITAPALLAWGEHDQVVPLSVMRTFRRLLPSSTVRVMEDIGHVPQIEAPRRAAEDYRRFRLALSH
jgi:abhydrolase domain-containing protein 6